MKKRYQFAAVAVILISGIGGMKLIAAAGHEEPENEVSDNRPVVSVDTLIATNHTIEIESYGAVAPTERTMLAAKVAGQITSWHPKFVPGGIIPKGEILFSIEKDTYSAALLVAEANLQQAKANLIEAQAQSDVAQLEAKKFKSNSVSDLYLKKPQLISAQAFVKSAEAQLSIAQRDLDSCDVRAPYDALVISRNIGVGDFISVGAVAGELNNIEKAEITLPIAGFDNQFVDTITSEQTVKILPSSSGKEILGVLNRDTGIIDEETRMTHFVVRVDDPYGLKSDKPALKFGSYVTVKFDGVTLENTYQVPQQLINNGKLWMVDSDGKLLSHTVTVLRENGPFFVIQADSAINQPVVVTLPEYPKEGMSVKVISSSDESDNHLLTAQRTKK